jgi:GNAT superfamily N-acetyltransferase
MHPEWHRDGYTISSDPARLDLGVIHEFLSTCYWAEGIPLEMVRKSIEHSINFGVYHDASASQVGYARVITDRATFGYLGDVFVIEDHRGRGLSKFLMECIDAHPELGGFRRWVLLTRDAHALYRQFGWAPVVNPDRYMERWTPGIYRGGPAPEPVDRGAPAPGPRSGA